MAWNLQEVYEIQACSIKKFKERYTRFDSLFEMEVYGLLLKHFPKERIGLQVPIQLVPPCICFPKGKMWRVDFAIYSNEKPQTIIRLVEVKGMWMEAFTSNLALLELVAISAFKKLDIVVCEIPKGKTIVKQFLDSNDCPTVYKLNDFKVNIAKLANSIYG